MILFSLFNVVLFAMVLSMMVSYTKWSVGVVKGKIKKINARKIEKWLEKENKEYYSKKLIRWLYSQDSNEVVVHNLRLLH
jgi:hypothetical protein